MPKRTDLEWLLWANLHSAGIPPDAEQFYFAKPRRYRADFAYTDAKILVEAEGGNFSRGRHVRPLGYQEDCSKYNLAALLGYRVLRFTRAMIESGEAVKTISQALSVAQAA